MCLTWRFPEHAVLELGQCEVKAKGKVTGHTAEAPPNHNPDVCAPDVQHGQSRMSCVTGSTGLSWIPEIAVGFLLCDPIKALGWAQWGPDMKMTGGQEEEECARWFWRRSVS